MVIHDGSLPRDAFGQIEVPMDDGFSPILLGLCMRCFGAVKKVYFECILGLV
jgi:hypothetical protein